jgi:hypothetical protein
MVTGVADAAAIIVRMVESFIMMEAKASDVYSETIEV